MVVDSVLPKDHCEFDFTKMIEYRRAGKLRLAYLAGRDLIG